MKSLRLSLNKRSLVNDKVSINSLKHSLIQCRLRRLSPTRKNLKSNLIRVRKRVRTQPNFCKPRTTNRAHALKRKRSKSCLGARANQENQPKHLKPGGRLSNAHSKFRVKFNGKFESMNKKKAKMSLMDRIYDKISIDKQEPRPKRGSVRFQRKSKLLNFSNWKRFSSSQSKKTFGTSIMNLKNQSVSAQMSSNLSQIYLNTSLKHDSSALLRSPSRVQNLWMELRNRLTLLASEKAQPARPRRKKNSFMTKDFIERKDRRATVDQDAFKLLRLNKHMQRGNARNKQRFINEGFFIKRAKRNNMLDLFLRHDVRPDKKIDQKVYDNACIQYTIRHDNFKNQKIKFKQLKAVKKLFGKRWSDEGVPQARAAGHPEEEAAPRDESAPGAKEERNCAHQDLSQAGEGHEAVADGPAQEVRGGQAPQLGAAEEHGRVDSPASCARTTPRKRPSSPRSTSKKTWPRTTKCSLECATRWGCGGRTLSTPKSSAFGADTSSTTWRA